MEKETLEQFVIRTAPYLTVIDMMEETGLSRNTIQGACDAVGVIPVRMTEQTRNFILTMYKHHTFSRLAKIMKCSEASLRGHYKALGISVYETLDPIEVAEVPVLNTPKGSSVRQILGSFKTREANHYIHSEMHQIQWQEPR